MLTFCKNETKNKSLIYLFISLLISVIFIIFPQIDTGFSKLFYNNGFHLRYNPFYLFVHKQLSYMTLCFSIIFILLLIYFIIFKPSKWKKNTINVIFLILVMSLGSGVIVNDIMKKNFGRARPYQTKEFGGAKEFTPAWIISDNCQSKNCSFTSGHAAAGFFLLSFVFLINNQRKRKIVFITTFIIASIIGYARIAQGAHYLSDVIFSGLIMYGLAWTFNIFRKEILEDLNLQS